MKCKQIEPQLTAYLDDELTTGQNSIVVTHLKECTKCQKELEILNKCNALIKKLDTQSAELKTQPNYQERVLNRINQVTKPRVSPLRRFLSLSKDIWKWELATAAGLLLVIIFLIFGPSPYDEYYIPEPGSQYSVKPAGKKEWVKQTSDYQFKKGDMVKTESQTTQIRLPDKTTVRLKENTEIEFKGKTVVNKSISPGVQKQQSIESISLNSGEIYVETHHKLRTTNNESRIKVETPAGEIIDKGTKFNVRIEPQKEGNGKNPGTFIKVLVIVMEGQVIFSNSHGEQVVNAGETAIGQAESKPSIQLEPKIMELIQQLGSDDWQKRESAQKELTEYGIKLIEQYRMEKIKREKEIITKLKGNIERFAQAIQKVCQDTDSEIKMRATRIRQYFYPFTQQKIIFITQHDDNWGMCTMDADGENEIMLITTQGHNLGWPSFSSDNTKIVYTVDNDIYVMSSDGKNQIKLTDARNQTRFTTPDWSPDGSQIAFTSNQDGSDQIYIMDADGKNQKRLTEYQANNTMPRWSPDGTRIVFTSLRDNNLQIYLMDTDGKNQKRLTEDQANNTMPRWSPDGTRIVFSSLRSGKRELYLMDADGKNQKRLIETRDSSTMPAWSPDGTKIVFASFWGDSTSTDNNFFSSYDIYLIDTDRKNLKVLTEGMYPMWNPALPELSGLFSDNSEQKIK